MDEHNAALEERVRSALEQTEVPHRSLFEAMAKGRRRRRLARVGVTAGAVLLVASIAVPVALLSGLHHRPTVGPASRSIPPARCVLDQKQPKSSIGCEAAVAQAWSIAAFLRTADSAHAELRSVGVREGYGIPAWLVTFAEAQYLRGVRETGCESSGTLPHYTVVVSAASGRPLGHQEPPPGCRVRTRVPLISPTYAGKQYVSPEGWRIVVPYGWPEKPFAIRLRGIEVRGVQILNPPANRGGVPKPQKEQGTPAQSVLAGTDYIGVVIAIDTDTGLRHQTTVSPPFQLQDFAQGSGGRFFLFDVAWVHRSGRDIEISVKVGKYAFPDDVMLLNSMLRTFELTSGAR